MLKYTSIPSAIEDFYSYIVDPIYSDRDLSCKFIFRFLTENRSECFEIIAIKINPDTLEFIVLDDDGASLVYSCKLIDALDFVNTEWYANA
jgi:hypothetical protein